MTHPLQVSVIIPTRNYGRFLGEALDSVLAQNWPELNVVVVDDASEDNTPEIIRSYGDRIHSLRLETCGGTAAARNAGLGLVSSGVVCFLDSDDVWMPEALKTLVGALVANPEADGACARMVNVPQEVMTWACKNPESVVGKAVQGWQAGAVAFRRECFEKAGGFDESMPNAEFVEWISRARDAGMKFVLSEELVVLRRVHGSNKVLTRPTLAPGYLRLVQQHLQRKRAAGSAASPE